MPAQPSVLVLSYRLAERVLGSSHRLWHPLHAPACTEVRPFDKQQIERFGYLRLHWRSATRQGQDERLTVAWRQPIRLKTLKR
jgi:hypothetical protein